MQNIFIYLFIRNDIYHDALVKFIDAVPKAELYLHVGGTLAPELMLSLANKKNMRRWRTSEMRINSKTYKAFCIYNMRA